MDGDGVSFGMSLVVVCYLWRILRDAEVVNYQNSGLGIKLSDFFIIMHGNARAYVIRGISPEAYIDPHPP